MSDVAQCVSTDTYSHRGGGDERERLGSLAARGGGKAAAAVAACSAATPVIGVCMSKISRDGVNLPNPLHQTFARVGGIFSVINITTGVFFSAALRDE